jgi:Arc/MetJ family transcription regulator
MRTTLELDDALMDALMARLPGKSKTKAVEVAIDDYVRKGAAKAIRELQGKVVFEDPEHWRRNREAERTRGMAGGR